MCIEELENLASSLCLHSIPDSWNLHWNESQENTSCVLTEEDIPAYYLELMDLPEEAVQPLREAISTAKKNPDLFKLTALLHHLIYHLPGPPEDSPKNWPRPEIMDSIALMFPLVVLVSGMHHTLARHKSAGVPEDVTRKTLCDYAMWVRDYHKAHGKWGISDLFWLRRFARGDIYRLGRLQHEIKPFMWPFRILRNELTDEITILCENGEKYRNDGLVDGTNDINDPEAWVSNLIINSNSITGSPVSDDGRAIQEPVTLSYDEWEEMIVPGSDIIDVHIPKGSKMDNDQCEESFQLAKKLFPVWFPNKQFRAFTCYSWLIDPALPEILPANSNISLFQRRWRLVPSLGSDASIYGLAFGTSELDISTAPRETALQRGVIDYVQRGGRMRHAVGFIPIC